MSLTALFEFTGGRLTITAEPPDALGGWSCQFQRRAVGTQSWSSHGLIDTSDPFSRAANLSTKAYEVRATFTRGGTSVVMGPITVAGMAPPIIVNPPPTPDPINAVVSDWVLSSAGPWGACVSGSQTRTETWVRSVITPAQYGGTTPALSEQRQGTQACVSTPPPGSGLPSGAVQIAAEWDTNVPIAGTQTIYYGGAGQFISKSFTSVFDCTNTGFGNDPFPGVGKACYAVPVTASPVNCEWSAWSAWGPWVLDPGGATETRTRTRTIAVPAANGGTACTGASSETEQQAVTPPPPPPSGTRLLLTPSDLTYVGKILLPLDDPGQGTRFGYSRGTMTGRRLNNEVRLFITGSVGGNGDYNNVKDAIYEVRPGTIGQRATLVRNWGNIGQGRLLLRDTQQEPTIRGLYYTAGRLWWAYGSNYFTGSDPDPSIGCTLLNDSTGAVTRYGPWRTQEHSQMTRGYMVEMPSDYAFAGGRTFGVGAPVTSGNANGPRGSVLTALDNFDPTSLAPDTAGNGVTHVSVNGKRIIFHDWQHPQERNGNYKKCGWNVNYDSSQGGYLQAGNPSFENNDGMALDMVTAAAWVRTPTRDGIVFIGQMTDVVAGVNYGSDSLPHMWYGPQDTPCIHGQTGNTPGTGPKSASEVPMLFIYDPATVAASGTPWGFQAASASRLNTISGVGSAIAARVLEQYQFGGAWFDQPGKRLYVCETQAESVGEPRPVIHVFSVT